MHLQLISFVLTILHCMDYTGGQQQQQQQQQQLGGSRPRQHKQMSGLSSGCQQGGCLTCSDYNGCLSCKPRFFMHLERIGMKQIGVCMTSCPPGFYGTRSPERNTCTKCRSECDSCFNKNFCTRCRAGFYLHLGKCQESCPEALAHSEAQRECVPKCLAECEACLSSETCTRCRPGLYQLSGRCLQVCPDHYEPNHKLMECTLQVHCEVGEWSEWSPCSRSGRTCGFRRGQENRSRQVLRHPSALGQPCPDISEVRECQVKRRKCPERQKDGGRRKNDRRERRNRNNRKDKENAEARRDRKRGRERDREAGEREDSRNKTEQRQRRRQDASPHRQDSQTVSPHHGLLQ